LLFDAGTEVGTALVKHPLVRAVGFTGSQRGGRALMDLAAGRPEPIPVYAEMGSTNPVFLLPGALAARGEQISEGLHGSVTLGAGQFCTKPGLVFLQAGEEAKGFAKSLGRRISETPSQVMLTPHIKATYTEHLAARAIQSSVSMSAQGKAAPGETGVRGAPTLFSVSGDDYLHKPRLEEEVFGPATMLVTCGDRE